MTTIATLHDKLETLRALEAQHHFGAVITPGTPLAPLPDLPAGTAEVFSLFGRLQGSVLLFKPPRAIRSAEAWQQRGTDGFPLGEPLVIGAEIETAPEYFPGEDEDEDDAYGGAPIRMNVDDGHVYYIDPEDYISLLKNPDAFGIEITTFAPDLVTFFDQYVLGAGYPRLVEVVLGEGVANRRHRKTGEYGDSWRRLLIAAGLAE